MAKRKYLDEVYYDMPQTFAGSIVQALKGSPKYVRTADLASSILQATPLGLGISALDLGRDLNRMYHNEPNSGKDSILDTLSMLPFLNKIGLKAPDTFINSVKANKKLRNITNTIVFGGKAADFIDDTYGSDKTSNSRRTLATGGSIHIKPENRGKFTATMQRTGKSAEELSHSKNPLTRKRAIFALNARKWKH